MPDFDYGPIVTVAQDLIKDFGREVTFINQNETPADATKPWQGPTAARTAPKSTLKAEAVFVQPDSASKLGRTSISEDLIKRSDQIMIVPAGTTDLIDFQEVLDGTVYWKIVGIETLRPADTTILYFVGVAR